MSRDPQTGRFVAMDSDEAFDADMWHLACMADTIIDQLPHLHPATIGAFAQRPA